MSEQLEQNKQSLHAIMTPMLDYVLPPPIQQNEMVRAELIGVDKNDPEAGWKTELGSVHAMIMRLASDMVTIAVFHDLGRVDDDTYAATRKRFEEKVAFQLNTVGLEMDGIVYGSDGEQFDVSQLANEAFDAVYPKVEENLLKQERENLLNQVDDINQRLQRYERPLTVEQLLPTKLLDDDGSIEDATPREEDELMPVLSNKSELHTGIGRRILDLVRH